MSEDIIKKFERKHLENIQRYQGNVRRAYLKAINKIFANAAGIKLKDNKFDLNNHPVLKNRVEEVLIKFRQELEFVLINGIEGEWQLSTEKNANVITKALAIKKPAEAISKIIYDPHTAALNQFISRKSNGLSLSDRVWRYTNQFQNEIEQGLYVGISEGRSAAEMARDQKQYLQEPNKLFRRVRNASGKLVLSKAAREYHPGQGVYRSSYKNAFRLTRDITNDSYRSADIVRYQSTPFILGYTVKLSNNHPKYDICDELKGDYGKDFVWRKWHIQCMCYSVPKLPTPEEYDKYEDALLSGNADNYSFKGEISGVPPQFNAYIKSNTDRMINWKRKPDWVTDNKAYTKDIK
jgi:hypothetical protein